MISAPSNQGAASSAKRIISTAPMAKLAATMQLGDRGPAGETRAEVGEVLLGEAGGARPRHGCPGIGAEGQRGPGRLDPGEVDHHLGAGARPVPRARRRPRTAGGRVPISVARSTPAWAGSTAATSSRSGWADDGAADLAGPSSRRLRPPRLAWRSPYRRVGCRARRPGTTAAQPEPERTRGSKSDSSNGPDHRQASSVRPPARRRRRGPPRGSVPPPGPAPRPR